MNEYEKKRGANSEGQRQRSEYCIAAVLYPDPLSTGEGAQGRKGTLGELSGRLDVQGTLRQAKNKTAHKKGYKKSETWSKIAAR